MIVVVILGVLAAIAIPQYNSTKGSSYDAMARSDLRNLLTHQEEHRANFGQYASDLAATGAEESSTVVFSGSSQMSVGEDLDITSGGGDGSPSSYTAQARHPSSENCWEVSVGSGGDGQIEPATSCSLGGG